MRVYSLKILSLQIMEFYLEYYFCIFKFTRAYVSVKIQKYGFLMKIDTENCIVYYIILIGYLHLNFIWEEINSSLCRSI